MLGENGGGLHGKAANGFWLWEEKEAGNGSSNGAAGGGVWTDNCDGRGVDRRCCGKASGGGGCGGKASGCGGCGGKASGGGGCAGKVTGGGDGSWSPGGISSGGLSSGETGGWHVRDCERVIGLENSGNRQQCGAILTSCLKHWPALPEYSGHLQWMENQK